MSKIKQITVIDLFAGPGGLAEGFSSVLQHGERNYDIRLSVEKDENAHKTLQLRSFYRQFPIGKVPEDYYKVLREKDLSQREILKDQLFEKYQSTELLSVGQVVMCPRSSFFILIFSPSLSTEYFSVLRAIVANGRIKALPNIAIKRIAYIHFICQSNNILVLLKDELVTALGLDSGGL